MFVRVASSLVFPRYLTFEPEVFSSHGRQQRHPFPSMCVVQWLWYILREGERSCMTEESDDPDEQTSIVFHPLPWRSESLSTLSFTKCVLCHSLPYRTQQFSCNSRQTLQ